MEEEKLNWEKPSIDFLELKLTEGKYDNAGLEIPPSEPGGGLVGPGS